MIVIVGLVTWLGIIAEPSSRGHKALIPCNSEVALWGTLSYTHDTSLEPACPAAPTNLKQAMRCILQAVFFVLVLVLVLLSRLTLVLAIIIRVVRAARVLVLVVSSR